MKVNGLCFENRSGYFQIFHLKPFKLNNKKRDVSFEISIRKVRYFLK